MNRSTPTVYGSRWVISGSPWNFWSFAVNIKRSPPRIKLTLTVLPEKPLTKRSSRGSSASTQFFVSGTWTVPGGWNMARWNLGGRVWEGTYSTKWTSDKEKMAIQFRDQIWYINRQTNGDGSVLRKLVNVGFLTAGMVLSLSLNLGALQTSTGGLGTQIRGQGPGGRCGHEGNTGGSFDR